MTKCILIVDDEEDIRSITKMALEMGTDWTILTASSGLEALEVAATNRPDTILLDMMMPGMDGRATLKQLKANAATQLIPVIMVTAKAQPNNLSGLEDLEVAAVLAKPFRPLKLAGEIITILGWS
ncbi:response regulator [Pseudanabaena sp. FACHB-2040]|uniref:response regulator n=1 Tax=Pseudanabaena sp. FACHB-2040 TaxID=2692859 RepID=UPI001684EFF0|nr:response regulator [Pseudanabaena sp. FACHB-2040]MBD2260409.1 response regulator [Pseudanabaena sp. FACHB-2040]